MNELEMAHHWAMKHGKSDAIGDRSNMVKYAWDYADAMQAEGDKRKPKGLLGILKMTDSPQLNNESILHDIDCYFDNTNNTKRDADNLIQSIYEHLTGEVKTNAVIEWQPDWSQAPDDACCWFIGGSSWDIRPYWSKYIPCYKSETTQITYQGSGMTEAPSFDYQGDWRDSLRKRP